MAHDHFGPRNPTYPSLTQAIRCSNVRDLTMDVILIHLAAPFGLEEYQPGKAKYSKIFHCLDVFHRPEALTYPFSTGQFVLVSSSPSVGRPKWKWLAKDRTKACRPFQPLNQLLSLSLSLCVSVWCDCVYIYIYVCVCRFQSSIFEALKKGNAFFSW